MIFFSEGVLGFLSYKWYLQILIKSCVSFETGGPVGSWLSYVLSWAIWDWPDSDSYIQYNVFM